MVSVIVPVYNADIYIKKCVGSVLAQSHPDWELILVDDGSTDFSGEIIDELAESDARIRALHFPNGGMSVARNRGLEAAFGEYIFFLDADDQIHPRTLEILLRVEKEHPGAIVQTGFFRGKNAEFSDVDDNIQCTEMDVEKAIETALYQKGVHMSVMTHLYPAHVFEKQLFRPGCYYEDLDAIYRFYEQVEKVVVLKGAPLYFYRDTPGSVINVWRKKRLDVLDVTARLEEHVRVHHPAILKAAKERRLSANFNMFIMSRKHGDAETASACWELIKRYRMTTLFNPKARMKSRVGALVSLLGKNAVLLLG